MSTPTDSTPPPLFTRREKYALAVLTLSFIVASALVHVVVGSVGSSLFPRFQQAAAAPIERVIIENLARATPTPAPTPHVVATALPHAQQTDSRHARPPAHPPHPNTTGTTSPHIDIANPTGPPVVTPVTPPTAQPVVEPSASPTAATGPEQIIDGDFVRKVTPDYPDIARDENIEGTVTVRVTIGPDGQVEAAVAVQSSGSEQLDNAALKAARDSLYRAPLLDGKPTTRDYLIVYTFSLDA